MAKGKISVHTDNLLPIIKKWLYSDKDIFLRELVSNAQDAITKLKKLSDMGEVSLPEGEKFEIKVLLNKSAKTIKIADNGIGMTAEEVEKYINQVAFSGAEDFIAKYEKENDKSGQIIGHFGLGFYSAFMAAGTVYIDTLSYLDSASPVHWESDGGAEFEMSEGAKADRGTVITLNIAEDSEEFLDIYTLQSTLRKYCGFLPIEIYVEDEEDASEDKKPTLINNTNPLWLKKPSECTDDEYKAFYREVFMDFNEPLFWIHLNVDFPFNLKGILYFPKLNHELQSIEGQIKLYNNQVFIADNIKEVTPEYLMLLKGVIDCPDLPLNVSRSFLQNDGYVSKVSAHITKKVADKLTGLYKNEKEKFEGYWDDISPFVKYGCLRDDKFYDRVKDILLFKKLDNVYMSLKDITDGEIKEVYYVTDADKQAQYIELLKTEGIEPVLLTSALDNHFVSFLEYKVSDVKFKRVDSYIADSLKEEGESNNKEDIAKLFCGIVPSEMKIDVQNLKSDKISAMFVLSEEGRRMQEMAQMFGNMGMGLPPQEETLVVNSNSPIVKKALDLPDGEVKELICKQIFDIAKLSHKNLSGDDMNEFINRTSEILLKLAEK